MLQHDLKAEEKGCHSLSRAIRRLAVSQKRVTLLPYFARAWPRSRPKAATKLNALLMMFNVPTCH
jgi:hypothetical protein